MRSPRECWKWEGKRIHMCTGARSSVIIWYTLMHDPHSAMSEGRMWIWKMEKGDSVGAIWISIEMFSLNVMFTFACNLKASQHNKTPINIKIQTHYKSQVSDIVEFEFNHIGSQPRSRTWWILQSTVWSLFLETKCWVSNCCCKKWFFEQSML